MNTLTLTAAEAERLRKMLLLFRTAGLQLDLTSLADEAGFLARLLAPKMPAGVTEMRLPLDAQRQLALVALATWLRTDHHDDATWLLQQMGEEEALC